MARGRPHGWSKSDHRVCQAARYARAAEYREKITISAEQQEARIAAVNAECNVEDAPRRRWRQKSRESKTKAGAATVSAGGRSRKASGSAKKKAKKGLEHALGKAAERDPHALHCDQCGATAEFGLRGGKEGGKVKFVCRGHVHSTGCFRIDRDRADWAEDREMRRLRAEERRLEEELRNLGGASFTAKPPYASEKSQSAGSGASMPMSRSLLATLLLIGGIERNPGPAADKGNAALQGRTSSGWNAAQGSVVKSGRPPYLLPSLEALNPPRLVTSWNWRVSHEGGLDPLAGLPERADKGGQSRRLHLRLRGGADDDPMDQEIKTKVIIWRTSDVNARPVAEEDGTSKVIRLLPASAPEEAQRHRLLEQFSKEETIFLYDGTLRSGGAPIFTEVKWTEALEGFGVFERLEKRPQIKVYSVVKRGQDAETGQSADVDMQDADQGNQNDARRDILALQNLAAISETNSKLTSEDLERAREEEKAASKKRKQANLASSPHFVAERLSELFGDLYDKDVGRRMDERANGRVGEVKPGANGLVVNIGSRFKLAGYDEFLVDLLNTIAALVERLDSEEVAPQEKIEGALHLGRIIAGPGLGKSTVLQESWIRLHKLVTRLSKEDKRRVFEKTPRLLEALRTCISPERMLVFHLSFQRPDQGKYHPFERELREQDQDWDRVLALRLLHACLSKEEEEGAKSEKKEGGKESIRDYELFWETFMEQEKELLKNLSSMKVLDFIRKRAGLADDQHALIVFTFDELEAINHAPKSKVDATIGQHLMSASARLRQRLHNLQCRRGEHGRTFAISLAASTRASATALSLTASEKAGIVDLHVPIQTYLSLKSISLDLFRRSNIAIDRGNMPETFKACLRFLGGVPRTLDRLLVALSGGDAIESIRKLDLEKLREVLQTDINPKLALRDVLDAYQDETKMRRWKDDPVKGEMMESMLAYGLTGEKVLRDGFADSEKKVTWQMLESDGFIHLEIEKKEPQVQKGRRDSAGSVDLTPGESSAVCGEGGEGASGQAVLVGGASAEAAIEEQRSQRQEQGRAVGRRPRGEKQGGEAKGGEGASLVEAQARHRDRVNGGAVSEAVDDDNAEVHGNDPVSRYKRIVSLLCGKRKKRRARTQQEYTVQVCPIIFFAGANCSPISRQMWLPIFHAFDIEWRNREETDLQIPMLKLYVYKKFFNRSTVELQQLFPGLPEELATVKIVVPYGGWVRRKDQKKYDKEDMPRLKAQATLERDWAHLGPGNYGWDGVYFFFRASEEAGGESMELAAEGGDVERSSSQAGGARGSDTTRGGPEAEASNFQTRVQSKKRVRNPTGSAGKHVTEWAPQKVKASTINWEMDGEETKQGRSDLIVYVTDHCLDSERSELSENITVVDATLMPKYYGPFFYMKDALDAAFHGANRHNE